MIKPTIERLKKKIKHLENKIEIMKCCVNCNELTDSFKCHS